MNDASSVLDSLALTRFPPHRQVAKLRELAEDAFRLSEIMHVPDARHTLIDAAVAYAEVADALERRLYPASVWHYSSGPNH